MPGRTLILGLGNPILGDDGVGWCVVEALESRVPAGVECDRQASGGLALMERLVGYDRVILIDAIQTRNGRPGAVYRFALDDLPTLHTDSAHDASLQTALDLGRRLGARLPEDIVVIAIEAADVLDFDETLSAPVAAAVPAAVALVMAALDM